MTLGASNRVTQIITDESNVLITRKTHKVTSNNQKSRESFAGQSTSIYNTSYNTRSK
jgi:hypothetical protein